MWSVAYQLGDSSRGVVSPDPVCTASFRVMNMCWRAVWEATDVIEDGVTANMLNMPKSASDRNQTVIAHTSAPLKIRQPIHTSRC